MTWQDVVTQTTLCIILHYGSSSDTWRCVRTLTPNRELDIVVADNDPAQALTAPADLADRVRILRTGGSVGFGAANNMAVSYGRRSQHDSVLLLNNDTLAGDDAVSELLSVVRRRGVGAVGPCMPVTEAGGRIWACGGIIDRTRCAIRGRQPPADGLPCDVDYLPGAAILCRLEVWDTIGGLPERYFLGYEEAEFALRIRCRGYRVMVAPSAIVLHRVGMSADRQPMYVYNSIRGRIRLGQCLWGSRLGSLIASIHALREARDSQHGLVLWGTALVDEVRGRAFDKSALEAISKKYRR